MNRSDGGKYYYAVDNVAESIANHDVDYFFAETTTYTPVHEEITFSKRLPESKLSCPKRMTLTKSGRLCYAYVIDLSIEKLVWTLMIRILRTKTVLVRPLWSLGSEIYV